MCSCGGLYRFGGASLARRRCGPRPGLLAVEWNAHFGTAVRTYTSFASQEGFDVQLLVTALTVKLDTHNRTTHDVSLERLWLDFATANHHFFYQLFRERWTYI